MNIEIYEDNKWINPNENIINLFKCFQTINDENPNIVSHTDGMNTISRQNVNQGYYLNDNIPIIDIERIKVFVTDIDNVEWYNARNYQIFAYKDYIYSNETEKYYHSKYSDLDQIESSTSIEIPLGLFKNICFKISRNSNGTIFYEKNDRYRTKVRISDHHGYQRYYKGFYNRMTDNSMFLSPVILESQNNLKIPEMPNNIVEIKTDEDENLCIICNIYKHNIIYDCGHNQICYTCTKKLIEQKNYLKCCLCSKMIEDVKKL